MPKYKGDIRPLHDEIIALDKALDEFVNDMRARLHDKAHRGYRGWDDRKFMTHIANDLFRDAELVTLGDKHHLHDIANRAMMLWWVAWRKDKNHPKPTGGAAK